MPYYKDRLLSAWGNDQVYEVGHPPADIDPDIEKNLKQTRYGRIAANPGKAHRNQVQRKSMSQSNGSSTAKVQSLLSDGLGYYTNVKIIYGNFGIKDFDFQYVTEDMFALDVDCA